MFLPAAPVETQAPAILALAALLILLGLLSTALLGHLLGFHIYLSKCPHIPAMQGIRVPRLRGTQLGYRALKPCTFPLLALCGGLISLHGLVYMGQWFQPEIGYPPLPFEFQAPLSTALSPLSPPQCGTSSPPMSTSCSIVHHRRQREPTGSSSHVPPR